VLGPRHPECPGDQAMLCTHVTGVCTLNLSKRPCTWLLRVSPLHSCSVSAGCTLAGMHLLSPLAGSRGSRRVSGFASSALPGGVSICLARCRLRMPPTFVTPVLICSRLGSAGQQREVDWVVTPAVTLVGRRVFPT
jgi:hypothetical protein